MKHVKQLIKEFWLPAIIAVVWGGVSLAAGGTRAPPWVGFVKDAAASFFLVSWATGQYFRVKKQTQVETHLQSIVSRLTSVVEQIERSAAKSDALITGGDSFCYVGLYNLDAKTNRGIFGVQHVGDHPLYDLTIRITDIDELTRLAEGATSIELNAGSTIVELTTAYAGELCALRGWELGPRASPRRYNIEIHARNGTWFQQMRVVRLQDRWVTATKVSRGTKCLFEDAYQEYPRDQAGLPIWD